MYNDYLNNGQNINNLNSFGKIYEPKINPRTPYENGMKSNFDSRTPYGNGMESKFNTQTNYTKTANLKSADGQEWETVDQVVAANRSFYESLKGNEQHK